MIGPRSAGIAVAAFAAAMLAIACASAPPAANEPILEASAPIAEARAAVELPLTAAGSAEEPAVDVIAAPPSPPPEIEPATTAIPPIDACPTEAAPEPEPTALDTAVAEEPSPLAPPRIEESPSDVSPEQEAPPAPDIAAPAELTEEEERPDVIAPIDAPAEPPIPPEEAPVSSPNADPAPPSVVATEPVSEGTGEEPPSPTPILDVGASQGEPVAPGGQIAEAPQKAIETAPPIPFDPKQVSEELKSATILDVRTFVDTLNSIIRTRNFDAWKRNLTKEYIDYYSDSLVLATLSESSVLQRMRITLRNLYDYFIYVVYPSRQNVKVDDIEFTSEDRIVVISLNSKGERLVLYELEKSGDSWAIGTGR